MPCQACFRWSAEWLCSRCRGLLRSGGDQMFGSLRVVGAFQHESVARTLMLGVKYHSGRRFLDLAAEVLADAVDGVHLVPVPRVMARQVRYGIDPALEFGRRLSLTTGCDLLPALRPALTGARRAGRALRPAPPSLGLVIDPVKPVALVDDVVTTGATLAAAARTIGEHRVVMALAANVASRRGFAT